MNAVVPILVLVFGIAMGIAVTGEGGSVREIVGSADAFAALMWASLVAVLVAVAMSLISRECSLEATIEHWSEGARSLLVPVTIVVLAWALAAVSDELGTANFLVAIVGNSLPVSLLPAIVFVTAAVIAFATGSSWGVMATLGR
jgi:Na+/H+ antiporter NhaC